jgi:hypothetical protein
MSKAKNAAAATGIAALVAAGAVALKDYVYIDRDGGGVVASYVVHYDQLQRDGVKVAIRGECDSACTVALGYNNVCLMPDSVLGFHPGYIPIFFGIFGYVLDPTASALMVKHYPPDAFDVIKAHGVDMFKDPGAARDGIRWYPKLVRIKGSEFPTKYQCKRE